MFRIIDMIDLPMIDCLSGQRLCTIRDVIVDMRENRAYALVCKERFFRRSLEAVPFRKVETISQNGVSVTGRAKRVCLRELFTKQRRFQSYQNVLGKLVINSKGETLGIIRDILIDTYSGSITAYELSEGYIDDFLRGRHIMELNCEHSYNGKNIILKDSNVQCLFNGK